VGCRVGVVQGSEPAADLERCSGVGPASQPHEFHRHEFQPKEPKEFHPDELHPDEQANHGWPHSSYLELGALPTAVACARLHARNVLHEWGLKNLAPDAELLVAELMASAVKATAARGQAVVRLRLSGDGTRVLIEVWDADRLPPAPGHRGEDGRPGRPAERGPGLSLVSALSARWDWYLTGEPAGKVVWCEIEA
jgi:anti-sigma regulatory factor (Ser/Thr protein kinase)